MKRLLSLFLSLIFLFSNPTSSLANCTLQAAAPTCIAAFAGNQWCDTGCTGCSATNPVLRVCDGANWQEIQKLTQTLAYAISGATTLTNDLTVSGTRALDFGANRLRNIATPTTTTDATRKDYVDALSGGLAVGASTSLDFGANRLKNIATPTATTDAATKGYVDSTSSNTIAFIFGDGSDGALTFDGTSTVLSISPSNMTYTLTRDIYGTSITINSGVTIYNAGYRIFCSGTFTNNGTVNAVGNNGGNGGNGAAGSANNGGAGGSAGTGGAALPAGYFPASLAGANGTSGTTGLHIQL